MCGHLKGCVALPKVSPAELDEESRAILFHSLALPIGHQVQAAQHGETGGHQGLRTMSSTLPWATCELWDPEQDPLPRPHFS